MNTRHEVAIYARALVRGSALVAPARLAIPIEAHRRLRIGGRRSMPEAEGSAILRSNFFVPQRFRGIRTDGRLQTLSCGVARCERI